MAAAIRFNTARVGVATVALVLALAGPGALHAATFTVTNTNDSGAGSLRQAILDANAAPGPDIVDFASGVTGTITLTTGELLITGDLTITGPGAGQLTISGGGASRVFSVDPGVTVTISALTVANGSECCGGGIFNGGTLTVSNSTVSGNTAAGGGGIHNTGTLTISNSTVSGNAAAGIISVGGGILNDSGTLTISSSTISSNTADFGAGIFNDGTLTVSSSTLSSNSAEVDGGGIYNNSGTVTVSASTFSANTTGCCGGGIFNNSGAVTVSSSTFSSNTVSSAGGGINNFGGGTLAVTSSTFSGNTADIGGGINNESGMVTVSTSTFSGNTVSLWGGGLSSFSGPLEVSNSTVSGNTAGELGGGIYNDDTLSVSNSTVSGNTASSGNGGGIFNDVDGNPSIKNSIVAQSPDGGNCADNAGTFTALGVNFADDASCPGFTVSAEINLGPLANNGGPTQTHALLPGSIAIDAVIDCTDVAGAPVTADQRGVARPQDGSGDGIPLCDGGAFEVANAQADLAVTKSDAPDPVVAGNNVTYTITVTNNGPSTAQSVTLADAVPASTTFVSFTAPAGWTTATPPVGGTGTVTATNPGVANGATATFTLIVRVNAGTANGTVLTNTATVTSVTMDPLSGNNSATATTTVGHEAPPPPPPPPPALLLTGAGPGGGPHVEAFLGASLGLSASFFAYDPLFHGGVFVAAGDVNGDGVADIVTGAGPGGAPHVKVFSGATGTQLASFFAYAPAFTGGVFVAAGDVNGDGRADVITGAGAGGGPQVHVFDGGTLGLLASFFAYNPAFLGGVAVGASR
jgi:uncharacterized repeat protein (TIGR01451 family)